MAQWRLGLTGGIGSGKSTVASVLQQQGAVLIDADAISRASTQSNGSAIAPIRREFGPDFIDATGALDRQRMREHVFRHPEARQQLETIVHPLVGQEIQRQLEAARPAACVVLDIPLLVESPRWRPQLDRVIVVDCSEATQRARVHQRNAWDDDTIEAVMRTQSPRLQRLAAADLVVHNDGHDLVQLRALVLQLGARFGL